MKRYQTLARILLTALVAAVFGFSSSAPAAKFSSAKVTKTINDVKLLTGSQSARPAVPGDVVSGSNAVQTGQKSRAELKFPDDSLVRIGSNSLFSFQSGKRDIKLEKGTMLMQVPKSLGKTQVKTAAVTAAITGTTILIEYIPPVLDELGNVIKPGIIKIIVVEGSLEFALNIDLGKKMQLLPGEMVALPPTARQLPKKVNVDLDRLVQSSALMRGGMGPLPSLQPVQNEVASQNRLKRQGKLVAQVSNLANNRGVRRLQEILGNRRAVRNARIPSSANPANRVAAPVIRTVTPPPMKKKMGPPPTPPIDLPDRPDRPNVTGGRDGIPSGLRN